MWHATRRPTRIRERSGDWQGLLADVEPALARFEHYVLDGEGSALVAADVALRYAMAKHSEVVSANATSGEPWGMDEASVLAETERVLDDLRGALRR